MLKRPYLAVLMLLAVWFNPGQAQAQTGYYFSLSDLKTLLVQNQQYFILDDEGFGDPSLNHLHFTDIDRVTGNFTGFLWAPVVNLNLPPILGVSPVTMPVSGTLTINSDYDTTGGSYGTGNYYGISFSWVYEPYLIDHLPCPVETASYTGGITFRGYNGGKMQATIAGTIDVNLSVCGTRGPFEYNPQPFSGILVK